MNLELSKHELNQLGQALSYAIMYASLESETAEFAMLKVKVEGQIVRVQESEKRKAEHDKMNCPFQYCDSEVKCIGKCKYS